MKPSIAESSARQLFGYNDSETVKSSGC